MPNANALQISFLFHLLFTLKPKYTGGSDTVHSYTILLPKAIFTPQLNPIQSCAGSASVI